MSLTTTLMGGDAGIDQHLVQPVLLGAAHAHQLL